jgi:hypothetical protein
MTSPDELSPSQERERYEKRRRLGVPTCRLVDAMGWLDDGRVPMPWPKALVAFCGEQWPRGGAFKSYLGDLVREEAISYHQEGLVLEAAGSALVEWKTVRAVPFNRRRYWERLAGRLSSTEWDVCQRLIWDDTEKTWAPQSLGRTELAQATPLSASALAAALARLLTCDLLDVDGGTYSATQALYPRNVFELRELRKG